jgi:mono/diheme cytochrome c family protein
MKKLMVWSLMFCLLTSLSLIVACGDDDDDNDDNVSSSEQSSGNGSEVQTNQSTAMSSAVSTAMSSATTGTQVTYINDIKALLDTNCIVCHKASNASGGVKLDTYADAKANGATANSEIQSGEMPQGGDPLSTADKALFQAWIDASMPE